MKFSGFDWDSGNQLKNEIKHGITKDSIEAFFQGEILVGPDIKHSSKEERFLALGYSLFDNRPMIVVFTLRKIKDELLIRPISARYMKVKEKEKYEKEFAKIKNE